MYKKIISFVVLVAGMGIASFAAASSYCTPSFGYGTPQGDYIARVLLTGNDFTLDNVTVGASSPFYTYYTTGPILSGGQSYSLNVTVGTYFHLQGVAAWIDYNQDGTFDASEKLGATEDSLLANASTTFNFTVPTVGVAGTTRMRVIEETYSTNISPCTSQNIYGETEDYDIVLTGVGPLVGGGKRIIIPVDICSDGDISPTPYDGLCSGKSSLSPDATFVSTGNSSEVTTGMVILTGTTIVTGTMTSGTVLTGVLMSTGTNISTGTLIEMTGNKHPLRKYTMSFGRCADMEEEGAYQFAYSHSLSTMNTCIKARMSDYLIRAEAAKMISTYAISVLHKTPDTNMKCSFSDIAGIGAEMEGYVVTSCQLGLMGLQGDGTPASLFNPNGMIDKAEFATILSRLLYTTTNNSSDACRYCKHVDALYNTGIITKKDNLFDPLLRGWALVMFMRAVK